MTRLCCADQKFEFDVCENWNLTLFEFVYQRWPQEHVESALLDSLIVTIQKVKQKNYSDFGSGKTSCQSHPCIGGRRREK